MRRARWRMHPAFDRCAQASAFCRRWTDRAGRARRRIFRCDVGRRRCGRSARAIRGRWAARRAASLSCRQRPLARSRGGARRQRASMSRPSSSTARWRAARLPDSAEQAIRTGTIDGVLHYSRRSSLIFLDCADAAGLHASIQMLTHYCLSPRAAEPFSARQFKRIKVAPHPDEAALLDLICRQSDGSSCRHPVSAVSKGNRA